MLKGCRKNVVYVKNTGSKMFEEAYFILSDNASSGKTEGDILSEAGKIIEGSPFKSYFLKSDSKKKVNHGQSALCFVLGAAVMAALNTVIYLLL